MAANDGSRPGGDPSAVWDAPALMRTALDQSEHFVGLLDLEGRVVAVNATALEFAGVTADVVLGTAFWETAWWSHSAELRERVRAAVVQARTGKTVRFLTTHARGGGTTRHVDFSIKPLIVDGQLLYLMPEGRDITALGACSK